MISSHSLQTLPSKLLDVDDDYSFFHSSSVEDFGNNFNNMQLYSPVQFTINPIQDINVKNECQMENNIFSFNEQTQLNLVKPAYAQHCNTYNNVKGHTTDSFEELLVSLSDTHRNTILQQTNNDSQYTDYTDYNNLTPVTQIPIITTSQDTNDTQNFNMSFDVDDMLNASLVDNVCDYGSTNCLDDSGSDTGIFAWEDRISSISAPDFSHVVNDESKLKYFPMFNNTKDTSHLDVSPNNWNQNNSSMDCLPTLDTKKVNKKKILRDKPNSPMDSPGLAHSYNGKSSCGSYPESPTCANCNVTKTSTWRKNTTGIILCNACGLYEKSRGSSRPNHLIKRRPRRSPKLRRHKDASDSKKSGAKSRTKKNFSATKSADEFDIYSPLMSSPSNEIFHSSLEPTAGLPILGLSSPIQPSIRDNTMQNQDIRKMFNNRSMTIPSSPMNPSYRRETQSPIGHVTKLNWNIPSESYFL